MRNEAPLSPFTHLSPTPRMPTLFVGHGNPMNAIEDNPYSRAWAQIGANLPRPQAILCVSAHWMTRGGSLVHVGAKPEDDPRFRRLPARIVPPAISRAGRARGGAGDHRPRARDSCRARRGMGARPRRLVGADAYVSASRRSRVPALARSRARRGGASRPRARVEAAARARRLDRGQRQSRPQSRGAEPRRAALRLGAGVRRSR